MGAVTVTNHSFTVSRNLALITWSLILSPSPRDSDLIDLGWVPGMCVSKQWPGDANAVGLAVQSSPRGQTVFALHIQAREAQR